MQNKVIATLLVAVIVSFGGGYLTASSIEDTAKDTQKTEAHDDGHGHEDATAIHMDHEMFTVPAEQAPTVSMSVEEDAKSGWNVTISTENFTFTPGKVNQENVVGEGHAHLYVDGEKVARVYGNSFHYPENFDGTKTFKVTLNANDHSEYAVGEEVIATESVVTHMHE